MGLRGEVGRHIGKALEGMGNLVILGLHTCVRSSPNDLSLGSWPPLRADISSETTGAPRSGLPSSHRLSKAANSPDDDGRLSLPPPAPSDSTPLTKGYSKQEVTPRLVSELP
jgi:hypothetical protein